MNILFLPGLFCRATIWEGAQWGLPEMDVIALDWPLPECIETYDDAADWLVAKIEEHEADVVVGHSLGGIVALHMAAERPEARDVRVVVVDAFLVEPHPFFRNHVWDTKVPGLEERLATMFEKDRPVFAKLQAMATGEDPVGWPERAGLVDAAFIYGGRSGEHGVKTLAAMAGIPRTVQRRVLVVPQTSHFLMLERPDAFYGALREVLTT